MILIPYLAQPQAAADGSVNANYKKRLQDWFVFRKICRIGRMPFLSSVLPDTYNRIGPVRGVGFSSRRGGPARIYCS